MDLRKSAGIAAGGKTGRARRQVCRRALRLSKKWLAPLFRGVHSSLAPTARPGSYARKPLLRKAFCGFDAHPPGGLLLSLRDNSPCVAKSDYSLRGAKPSAASGGGARRKPSEQGSARKAPRADAARLLRTALRPPNPRGFFDRLWGPGGKFAAGPCFAMRCPKRALRTRGAKRPRLKGIRRKSIGTKGENKMPRLSHVMERRSQGGKIWTALAHGPKEPKKAEPPMGLPVAEWGPVPWEKPA